MNKVIALYYRLSKQDEDCTDGVSNSISSQKKLLRAYVASKEEFNEYEVLEFCDDGYSGTNFDRPQVQEMLTAAEHNHIQVIIVKDFSRFGRNSIEVGSYLEEVFPYTGLRFISVNDNYDSNDYFGDTGGFEISIKNLISQTYAQDASKKIKSNFEAKARNGEFIPFKKIYGYTVTPDKKLVIDEKAAQVVKKIFEMKNAGKSYTAIAKALNDENVLVPKLYFKYRTIKRTDTVEEMSLWSRTILSGIINDERYTGNLIYGRYKSDKIRSKTFTRVPRGKWVVVENAHEAIISKELFQEVQAKKRTSPGNQKGKVFERSLFAEKVFCGCCGRALRKISYKSGTLKCITTRLSGNSYQCYDGYIYEKDIANIVMKTLRVLLKVYEPQQVVSQKAIVGADDTMKKIGRSLKSVKTKIATTNRKREALFQELMEGIIDDDEYMAKSNALEKKMIALKNENEDLLSQKEKAEQDRLEKEKFVSAYHEIDGIRVLTRETVEKLIGKIIGKIIVSKEGNIEIIWNFKDIFEEARKANRKQRNIVKDCQGLETLVGL